MASLTIPLTVRFRDLDALGHVNNAVYHTYLEEARVALVRHLTDDPVADRFDFLLARTEIDFLREVRHGADLAIEVWLDEVGTKSCTLGYELRVGDQVVARARTVLVWYDHEQGASVPVPDVWRERLSTLQRT